MSSEEAVGDFGLIGLAVSLLYAGRTQNPE
jgi:hypothetical protein